MDSQKQELKQRQEENQVEEEFDDLQQVQQKKQKGVKGILHLLFIRKWHPQPTVSTTILIFAVVGIIFIILGIVIAIFNSKIIEVELKNYQDEDNCTSIADEDNYCVYEFTIPDDGNMEPPVYLFYSIDNFYQNHRRYMKSKSSDQLSGQSISKGDAKDACDPAVYNKDMGTVIEYFSEENDLDLDGDDVANPCGLIAKSYFYDEFELYENESMSNRITINEKGIAWPEDVNNKFKQNEDEKDKQWIDPSNEHFIVWMRTAGLPNFRKLWGKIEDFTLKQGQKYYLKIKNLYDVDSFKGSKGVVLSTALAFGGKNSFLAAAFIIVGVICLVITIVFLLKKNTTGGSFGEAKQKDK
ncbi:hypothetical protein PPERSA_07339 [Pseudocohnilembus persalinus]|uniref:Uncharacterized protein n=1 Tax=Pseudocohnilembus persalinus TaxID=266149 RepID=A0A0V0QA40_PSEPJ|nr:hypothetical protein PPERSA_07339 [Pseudocohnilembus persalinus]|eukprot:KRW99086.1 hypothetical protein PPERSA_07339 [Pseudocohnilembus persalinus]